MNWGMTPDSTDSSAAASAASPTRGRMRRSRETTSAGLGAAAADSVAAIAQRPPAVVLGQAAGEQQLGVVAVDDARDAVAGGEHEIEERRGEADARLDAAAPG